MRLITIPMSHYCEKVRWALELLEVDYVEEGHVQGFHFPVAKRLGGGPFVPVLITPDGAVTDSTRINRGLDAGRGVLYPAGLEGEVLEWEERLDEGLGVEGRRWIYLQVLDRPGDFLAYAGFGAPAWERTMARLAYPMLKAVLRRRLDLTQRAMAVGWPVIEAALADVELRLAAGHEYLVGDQFTAADLTFAALMSALVLPERYGIPMPPAALLGPEGAAVVETMRARPAGRFALRMVEEHRPVPLYRRGDPAAWED